ncbi:hypothetical protein BKA63DRAFT_146239 [Paraphoma chrysanthemicola]|nr:hypothetical protein BKA63DRAFT_146239 [Paraphoma chrysanthemicola]
MDRTTQKLKEADPDQSGRPTSPWRTGVWRRLPRAGMLALLATVVAVVFMVQIIIMSDEQPIRRWRFQPTVFLSITYTVANIALQYALARAITIAWWAKALKGDAKVRDLHNIWAFGSGFWDILASGRSFNFVALAGLAVTLVPINGPLLQRSSIVKEQTRVELKNLTVPVALELPVGYTGAITARLDTRPTSLSRPFSDILKQYSNRLPMNVTNSDCDGACKGELLGAGYDIKCQNESIPFVVSLSEPHAKPGTRYDISPFESNFSYVEEDNAVINFTVTFKTKSTCDDDWTVSRCTLRPATIRYPILFTNDTISLDPAYSWKTDQTERLRPPTNVPRYRGPTTHGGMWLYLDTLYNSGMYAGWDGVTGWKSGTTGTTAFRYVNNLGIMNEHSEKGGCDISFFDPTSDAMDAVREIAFRTALFIPLDNVKQQDSLSSLRNMSREDWSKTYMQQILVRQTRTEVVYRSQYLFLSIAVALTMFAMLCVLILSLGWWHLGREVSMSPIEIAKAFAAPALESASSNAQASTILKEVGNEKLRYGATWDNEHASSDMSVALLRFDRPERSEKVREGQMLG